MRARGDWFYQEKKRTKTERLRKTDKKSAALSEIRKRGGEQKSWVAFPESCISWETSFPQTCKIDMCILCNKCGFYVDLCTPIGNSRQKNNKERNTKNKTCPILRMLPGDSACHVAQLRTDIHRIGAMSQRLTGDLENGFSGYFSAA